MLKGDQHFNSLSVMKAGTQCMYGRKFRDPHDWYSMASTSSIRVDAPVNLIAKGSKLNIEEGYHSGP